MKWLQRWLWRMQERRESERRQSAGTTCAFCRHYLVRGQLRGRPDNWGDCAVRPVAEEDPPEPAYGTDYCDRWAAR